LKTNYVLIDYENVHVQSLALLSGEHFRVRLFLVLAAVEIRKNLAGDSGGTGRLKG